MINKKILVVDDNPNIRKMIISVIKKFHPEYLLYQANNGEVAMSILENTIPDIILADWDMPVMDGLNLVQNLKRSDKTKQIPVIIITGKMLDNKDLELAFDSGAIDYIRKPIEDIELLARMNSALKIADYQKILIQEKNSKIVENVMFVNEMNSFLKQISAEVVGCKVGMRNQDEMEIIINSLLKNISSKIQTNGWQKFSTAVERLHPEFSKNILKKHPALTPADIQLSSMIRLGLSIKELSSLMFVTPESMRVFRSRLRKKLTLPKDQNLESYLMSI